MLSASEFDSISAQEEEEDLAVVLSASHVGAAEGSTWSVEVHVASSASFLCVTAHASKTHRQPPS